nr:galactose dehydrogenase [Cryptococcus depauperatus CBS 7855]
MLTHLPPYHPFQPEPAIAPFDIHSVPDEAVDKPSNNELLPKVLNVDKTLEKTLTTGVAFPPLILGCSTFGYGIYADDDNVKSDMPLRVVRLALRYGINAFDTSPWYHPSEIILGNVLRALEYQRDQYYLITKVGKYGPNPKDHIWEPEVLKASVNRSLQRLGTDYLDVVYLHDVEYALPLPSYSGKSVMHLQKVLSQPPVPIAEESKILEGIATLRQLQSQAKVTLVGIAGYPLPVLLRLALLTLHTTNKPLDVVQTYGHHTLQNSTLEKGFLQALTEVARVGRVMSASPLAMGILTSHGGPSWHPARQIPTLFEATRKAAQFCKSKSTTLQDVALSYGYRPLFQTNGERVPIVVGCTDLEQVHDTAKRWREVNLTVEDDNEGATEKNALEEELISFFDENGVMNWSWECPTNTQSVG